MDGPSIKEMSAGMASTRNHLQRLIGGLVLVLGITCAVASYILLSWLANKEVEQNAQKIAKQTELELCALLLPPTSLLNLLSNVPDLKTGRLDDWMTRLPAQGSLLRANEMLESVYVGGPEGQYLSLRLIKNQHDRKTYSVGDDVVWLVQAQRAIEMKDDAQVWLGLDERFGQLSRVMPPWVKDFDPRSRPWYKAASDSGHVIRTKPYRFYTSGREGVTLARNMGAGYVVAMDISLESLWPRLNELASKWSARLWLLDQDQRLIVGDTQHPDQDPLHFHAQGPLSAELHEGGWVEDTAGQAWWLGGVPIQVDGRSDMELRYAFPRVTVLGKAELVRNMLLGITALILVIVLSATNRVALRFSRPLEILAQASERVGRLDLHKRIEVDSEISEVRQLADEYERMRVMLLENQTSLVMINATLQAHLDDLNANKAELARSNAELEQIAYAAAHDLREPLRMVALYVSLLDKRYSQQLDNDGRQFIAYARQGAEKSNRMILNLLELSEIGQNAHQHMATSLANLVSEARTRLHTLLHDSGTEMTVADDLPQVIGDSAELQRLVTNLIDNAIRYRRPGLPPRISIGWRRVSNSHIEVGVTDNGMGIESAYLDRIFQMFERLHSDDAFGGGSGIGLTISKKIVECHGGQIRVESTPGQGTTVYFTLLAAESTEPQI